MKIITTICLGCMFFSLSFPITSLAPLANAEIIPVTKESSPIEVETYIKNEIIRSGLDWRIIKPTLVCESSFTTGQSLVPSSTGPNGREDSWGPWQIHLPSHPGVTREQAQDPVWSTAWAISKIKGGFKRWSCWPA